MTAMSSAIFYRRKHDFAPSLDLRSGKLRFFENRWGEVAVDATLPEKRMAGSPRHKTTLPGPQASCQ
jgi:hypothetical protein